MKLPGNSKEEIKVLSLSPKVEDKSPMEIRSDYRRTSCEGTVVDDEEPMNEESNTKSSENSKEEIKALSVSPKVEDKNPMEMRRDNRCEGTVVDNEEPMSEGSNTRPYENNKEEVSVSPKVEDKNPMEMRSDYRRTSCEGTVVDDEEPMSEGSNTRSSDNSKGEIKALSVVEDKNPMEMRRDNRRTSCEGTVVDDEEPMSEGSNTRSSDSAFESCSRENTPNVGVVLTDAMMKEEKRLKDGSSRESSVESEQREVMISR